MSEESWGATEAETEMDDITLTEFEALGDKCFDLKREITLDDRVLKEKKADLLKLQNKVMSYLQKYGKKNHQFKSGLFSVTQRTSVRLPQGDEKEKFFTYLKEKGIFEDMVHMNSQTLNSFYKAEMESHLADGDVTWEMPGVGEPIVSLIPSMRKG